MVETLEGTAIRHGYADLAEARLHYVEAGDGPLVVLLHGFPEFWYGWRFQIPALAGAGFRVVAPDMRGYNLSSRPEDVAAYAPARIAADIRDLIRERGADREDGREGGRARVAGHDWGAAIAWLVAMNHPDVVEQLAILNVPHPRRLFEGLRTPRQLAKSWYMFFFQLPWLPEQLVRARGWRAFRQGFEHDARAGAFTPEDIERYVESWSQPGAVTAMLNWYRAAMRRPGSADKRPMPPVQAPTVIIWGERDRYLGAELAEPHAADVPQLERVVILPGVSHWVQHDEPQRVSELLIEFFKN